MSSDEIILGVPQVDILEADPDNGIQDMSAITVTYANITPVRVRLRSINKPLLTTDTYKIALIPIGFDPNGGYTAGIATAESAAKTITAGQVVRWRIANSAFGTLGNAVAVGVCLKTNTSNYQLMGFQLINPTEDLTGSLYFKPSIRNPFLPYATLSDDTVTNTILGPRVGYNSVAETMQPTTEGVKLTHKKTKVTIKPDDTPDWQATTNCATDISFNVLLSDPETVIRAVGGNYIEFADSNGDTLYQGVTDLMTTAAAIPGCSPFRITMPPNNLGEQLRMYYGNLDVSIDDIVEDMTKDKQFSLSFNCQFSGQDKLLRQLHTGVIQLRQVA